LYLIGSKKVEEKSIATNQNELSKAFVLVIYILFIIYNEIFCRKMLFVYVEFTFQS